MAPRPSPYNAIFSPSFENSIPFHSVNYLCLFARLDQNGDGFISVDELKAHIDAVKEGTIKLDSLADKKMQDQMKKFDLDGDGDLKLSEISVAFKLSQDRAMLFKQMLCASIVGLLLSYVVLSGLIYYVIEVSKDTTIGSSGSLLIKGTDQTVQVNSAEFAIVNGTFYPRHSGTCSSGACQNSSQAAVQTSQVLKTDDLRANTQSLTQPLPGAAVTPLVIGYG